MGRILKLIYKLQDHFYKKYFYLKVVWHGRNLPNQSLLEKGKVTWEST